MARTLHIHLNDAGYRSAGELRAEQTADRAKLKQAATDLNAKIEAYNQRTKERIKAAMALGSNAEGNYIYASSVNPFS